MKFKVAAIARLCSETTAEAAQTRPDIKAKAVESGWSGSMETIQRIGLVIESGLDGIAELLNRMTGRPYFPAGSGIARVKIGSGSGIPDAIRTVRP